MDKWTLGLILLFLGMATCFVVLGLLAWLIKLVNRFFPHKEETKNGTPLPSAPSTPSSVGVEPASAVEEKGEVAVSRAIPGPLAAAIAAALAVATEDPGQWVVTAVHRVSQEVRQPLRTVPAWAHFGRHQLMSSRIKYSDREGSWRK